MHIKLQNFLFLVGASFIFKLLYIFLVLPLSVQYGMSDELFFFLMKSFLPVFTLLGLINLCSDKVAQYIYTKTTKHLPRLQWYSMFLSWIPIVQYNTKDIGTFTAMFSSCIVAALCYPKRRWKKRFLSAFIFSIFLFFFYLCE